MGTCSDLSDLTSASSFKPLNEHLCMSAWMSLRSMSVNTRVPVVVVGVCVYIGLHIPICIYIHIYMYVYVCVSVRFVLCVPPESVSGLLPPGSVRESDAWSLQVQLQTHYFKFCDLRFKTIPMVMVFGSRLLGVSDLHDLGFPWSVWK